MKFLIVWKYYFLSRKRNNNLFEEWANIESFHKKFLDFEHLDREIMPDGRPVPIIRYDSEKGRAEVVYSDGSRKIEEIVGAVNGPISDRLCLRAVNH